MTTPIPVIFIHGLWPHRLLGQDRAAAAVAIDAAQIKGVLPLPLFFSRP